jgi:ketosteroid isomerase-like protein
MLTSLLLAVALSASAQSIAPASNDATIETTRWFQANEQALNDAIAKGDTQPWDRVMDESCVMTSEEGEVLSKQQFLKALHPLPPGLEGRIVVRDLIVQEFPTFAVVRYLADEWEKVFGQELTTKYRVTNTYRKADASWKLVAQHVAVVTADPPPQRVPTDRWPGLVGTYQIKPDGWQFHVVLRDGTLYGGRDPQKLTRFIPLTPEAFVLEGRLGDWLFAIGADGKATRIVDFRKFEPLVWERISDTP